MNISLHIFTNCTDLTPSTDLIRQTYKSYTAAFGTITNTTVWVDPNPRINKFNKYANNLHEIFSEINRCNSLSDGYVKAILSSREDHCFMVEHDWKFLSGNIKHTLPELIRAMQDGKIYHLRFNKRANVIKPKFDRYLTEFTVNGIPFCKTPWLSNNPHILNRRKYLDFIAKGYIQIRSGSQGIEQIIGRKPDTWGAIYGGLNYPGCITHLDGKGKK
jgi:hypothetical protein